MIAAGADGRGVGMSVDDRAERRIEGGNRERVPPAPPSSGACTGRQRCSEVERLRAELAAMPDQRWTTT